MLAGRVLRTLLFLGDAHRPFDTAVGIIDCLVRLRFVGVEPGGDGDLKVLRAEVRRQRAADVLADLLRHFLFEREQIVRRLLDRIGAIGQEAAVDVEHGHVLELHSGDRRGDEVADRLAGGAIVAAVGADDHGGRGGLALAAEGAFIGEDDMHPRGLDGLASSGSCAQVRLRALSSA